MDAQFEEGKFADETNFRLFATRSEGGRVIGERRYRSHCNREKGLPKLFRLA